MKTLALAALLLAGCATTAPSPVDGTYRANDGRLLGISALPDEEMLLFTDYSRGVWRALRPAGDAAFTFGPAMLAPEPVAGRITFDRDTLTLNYGADAPLRATRLRFRERPLSWKNGDAALRGTLILPDRRGPHPAVVITQGSGADDRNKYRPLAQWFAAQGIAALIYDRRGVGESSGDARHVGFPDLAQDATLAATALARLPEIDAKRIGAWGQSQGGWIAPLAAARTRDIAWVIAVSGPAVTASEQELYRAEHQTRAQGHSEAEVEQAAAFARLLDRWRRTGEGRDELLAFSRANRDKPWARHLHLADESLPERISDHRRDQFWLYDPLPEFRNVAVPLLLLYGGADAHLPVQKSAELWRQVLADSGNRDGSVLVLGGTTHEMWMAPRDDYEEMARSPGYHPAYWTTIAEFLRRYVTK